MFGLTKRQHECYQFVLRYIEENGFSPSYEEIKDAMGFSSKSGVHRLVVGLEDRGAIIRKPHQSRSIEVVE